MVKTDKITIFSFVSLLFLFPLGIIGSIGSEISGIFIFLDYSRKAISVVLILLTLIGAGLIIIKHKHLIDIFDFFAIVCSFSIVLLFICHLITTDIFIGKVASGENVSTYIFHIPIILKYITYAGIGYLFWDGIKYKPKIFLLCWLLATIFIFAISNFNNMTLDYYLFKNSSERSVTLFASDTYAFTTLMSMYLVGSRLHKVCILVLALLALFLIGSRTAFFIMILSMPFIFIQLKHWKKGLISVCIIGLICNYSHDYFSNNFPEYFNAKNRMFTVFLDSDTSKIGRDYISKAGLTAIDKKMIWGDFGGQTTVSGDQHGARWGAYIHDFRSFFRQFGIFGLGFFIYLMFYPTSIIFRRASYHYDKDIHILLSFWAYVFLIYFLSRGFVYPYFMMLSGLCLKFSLQTKLMLSQKAPIKAGNEVGV